MSRGRGHVFDSPKVLNEMLTFRQMGVGPSDLGKHYGVDHSTIIYHCKRYAIVVDREVPKSTITQVVKNGIQVNETRPRVVISISANRVMTDWNGEVLNRGKTYAEYIADARRREQIKKFGHPLL